MAIKLAVQSLVDALYVAARERILTGVLAGGEFVTENDLATYYDVARPTAKAVIERLTHEGLLVRDAHKTARVRVMSVADIRDLYFSRGLLEREVMATLSASRKVPPAAHGAMEKLRLAADEKSVLDFVAADIAFHRALVDALGSPRLSRMFLLLASEAHLCMAQIQTNRLLHADSIIKEHTSILQAVETGRSEVAMDRITAHLMRACDQLAAYREQEAPQAQPTRRAGGARDLKAT